MMSETDSRASCDVASLSSTSKEAVSEDSTMLNAKCDSIEDLDSPQLEDIKAAIAALNATLLDNLAAKGHLTADIITDSQKLRSPLHHLIECYIAAKDLGGSATVEQKFSQCLAVMLTYGLDINQVDILRNTALHLLCQSCDVAGVIKTMLASGAKVNKQNTNLQTALHLAADNGNKADVEALLAAGGDPNMLDCIGYSPLHVAVKYRRNQDTIKCLIACNADVNLQYRHGRSGRGSAPLHVAVRYGRCENVRILLDLDARPDIWDSSGQTPLHLAAKYDITGDMITCLSNAGAVLDHLDCMYHETALHKALKYNMKENIKALLDAGMSPLIVNARGDSALETAALCCHSMDIWLVLLSRCNLSTNSQQTAVGLAARARNKLALNLLKQPEY